MALYTDIHYDAENGEIILQSVDESGARIAELPMVSIKQEDLQYAGTADAEMNKARLRRVHWTDLEGAKWRAYGLFTKQEDDETDDGHSSETEDLYVGGGGGGLIMCKITSLFGQDYLGVKKFDGTDLTGDEFMVAKSLPSRMVDSEDVDEVTFSYTYVDDNYRTSNDGTTTEAQVMFQRFKVDAIVWVSAVDFSGVSHDDGDIKFMEVNTAREWTKKYVYSA